jgi:Zn-dependent protease
MSAIKLWGVLSSSIYPPDEPPLPASVHIRRALGGPVLSLIVTFVSSILLFLLPPGTILWWLALYFIADNLLVFTLGALLPLGFTDGTTLLRWLRKPGPPQ